jgi:hypothetical protein
LINKQLPNFFIPGIILVFTSSVNDLAYSAKRRFLMGFVMSPKALAGMAVITAVAVLMGAVGIVLTNRMFRAESDMHEVALTLLANGTPGSLENAKAADEAERIHERTASMAAFSCPIMSVLIAIGIAAFLCVLVLTFRSSSKLKSGDSLDAQFERY